MAEVGLVPFARVALQFGPEVVPAYPRTFSRIVFSQLQLLAILYLMRCEDWTFRETDVRLAERGELRAALGHTSVPDHTTLYRCTRRLSLDLVNAVLTAAIN